MPGKDYNKYREKGVTLLEALVATAIIGIGFVAIFQMVNYSVRSIDLSSERTKVNYLVTMMAEDLIGDKNVIVDGTKTFKDKLLEGTDPTSRIAWDSLCVDGNVPTEEDNALLNKKNKWNTRFSKRRLKCRSANDAKILKIYDICSDIVSVDPKPKCTFKNSNTYFLESSGDSVMLLGRMMVKMNNGKKIKLLYFQID